MYKQIQTELQETCRRLLENGDIKLVIGYGRSTDGERAVPVFITRPEDVGQLVWDDRCFNNLVKYLLRSGISNAGRIAICVKGCDARSLVVLEKEAQLDRSQIVVIGLACNGMGEPRQAKCKSCDVQMPRHADIVIGQAEERQTTAAERYADIDEFFKKTTEERLEYWANEFSRCVKCYACRQVCPMCYCRQCIVDKNRPIEISPLPTLKGNFAWHIARAFHLAGRCTGCDECSRVCPAGINLRLLNLSLAKAAEENFNFRAGMAPDAEPIIGTYSQQDHEEFIR